VSKCGHKAFDEKCGWCRLSWKKDEMHDMHRAFKKVMDINRELYALRGEDPLINEKLNEAIRIADAWDA